LVKIFQIIIKRTNFNYDLFEFNLQKAINAPFFTEKQVEFQ